MPMHNPPHPGGIVRRQCLEPLALSVTAAASHLGVSRHRRNWLFVKQIEDLTQEQRIEAPDRVHINMYDCPQIFDALQRMTNHGNDTSAIAPYGPKTVSLAMCLFALGAAAAGKSRVPVYYAQPRRYALDYTDGVRMRGTAPDITGYCLRLSGRDLYALE